MTKSIFCSVVGLALGVAGAGCFSKPGFSGSDGAKDANGDGPRDGAVDSPSPDAPFVEPACTEGRTRLPDNIKLRTDQISVDDLDRNALDDVALIGEDDAGGQHVFIYFGQNTRDIDLNCWDHELIATDFSKIGGVKLEHGWYGGDGTKGTLFVFGQDAAEPTKIRLEAREVDRSQIFSGANFRVGPTGPLWSNEAVPHSAFLVWRYAGDNDQEIFFGGDNKFFTIPMTTSGMGPTIASVGNPNNVKIVQAFDVSGYELLIDDGRNFFNIERILPAAPVTLPTTDRLDPSDTGAANGEVFASQEWAYRFNNDAAPISYGVRVPRITTAGPTSLQLISRNDTFNKVLLGVSPLAVTGPFMTGGTLARNVGPLGNTLAAVVTTFTTGGQPATNGLAVEANTSLTAANIAPTQMLRLRAGAIPVVFAGNFRSISNSNIVVLYPRRTLSEVRTRSVCYEALSRAGMDCLRECGANVCAL